MGKCLNEQDYKSMGIIITALSDNKFTLGKNLSALEYNGLFSRDNFSLH